MTHSFHSFFQLIINEEWEILRWTRVQVQEILKIPCDGLLEQTVIVKGLLQEAVKPWLQIEKALQKRSRKKEGGIDMNLVFFYSVIVLFLILVPGCSQQGSCLLLPQTPELCLAPSDMSSYTHTWSSGHLAPYWTTCTCRPDLRTHTHTNMNITSILS